MAISPQIAGLQSSGTYRFEFNKSQTVSVPAEQIRLIVGFSKQGPFNTPVFVPDTGFFTEVFGAVDRGLERKGSFFHRTCLAALERGPILALNLLALNDSDTNYDIDYAENIPFSTSTTQANVGKNTTALYSGYYNKDKFWFPEDDAFLDNITDSANNPNKIFNVVNLGKAPLSVIVRKADPRNARGFNITAKEYYGVANVPDALHPDDYISDFMIDVIVLKGNFGADSSATYPFERFTSDPIFADYFDRTGGLKRKTLATDTGDTSFDAFLNLPEIEQVATYTGCLIPDFIDLNGNNIFIQDLINRDTSQTGLFSAVNRDAFDTGSRISGYDQGIDMIGHNLEYEQPDTVDFLSYKETIKSNLEYTKDYSTLRNVDAELALFEDVSGGALRITVNKSDNLALYNAITASAFRANTIGSTRSVGAYVQLPSGTFAPVTIVQDLTNSAVIELAGASVSDFASILATGNTGDSGASLNYLHHADLDFTIDDTDDATESDAKIIGASGSGLFSAATAGTVTDGDTAIYDLDGGLDIDAGELYYLDFNFVNYTRIIHTAGTEATLTDNDYYIPAVEVVAYEDSAFTTAVTTSGDFGFAQLFFDSDGVIGAADTAIIQTLKGSLNQSIEATETSTTTGTTLKPNEVVVSDDFSSDVQVGYYLVADVGSATAPSRLTRITAVSRDSNAGTLTITCVGAIYIYTVGSTSAIEVYIPVEDWVDNYYPYTLNGFSLGDYHLPDGTQDQQDAIINGALSGTALYSALIDRDNITYRYIVDSFGKGITAGSKAIFATMAKERQNALAILNAPSMKEFKASTDPSFLDATGAISTAYISDGGNLTLNPTVTYSLPSTTQGASYAAFFGPYLTVRDRGRNILVPPAGYISNNFVDKYTSALPWSIVAGTRRGVVGGRGVVGIEYNLSKDDRDNLEPFGYNPIVFQRGSGLVILGNKTAQQTTKSALSSTHVREVLIYIQDGIEAILKNYLYEFNTPQTRLEIKTLADNFMSGVLADNGVFDFRNIMDETNNTPDVIDANVGILDTYVEPVKGLEIIVHRTTVLKTGQISTGQFL